MNIKRIVISQPAPQSDKSPFSELATKHEIEIVFRPFIEVEGVSLKEFRKQRVEILDHSAVIMTSRTAIDHYFRIAEECRITIPDTMKYFCVSEAVALYLQKYIVYRKRKIFFAGGTFPELMEVLVKHKDEKYLVPLSDPHKPEIPLMLTKGGIKHNKVILSHTVSSDLKEINPVDFDILALYSPADVKSYIANFGANKGEYKIAIFGNGTARVAMEAGIKVDIMAPTSKFPSLTMALDRYIRAYNDGDNVEDFALRTLPEPAGVASKGVASVRKSPKKVTAAGA